MSLSIASVGLVSYSLSAVVFLILTLLLLTGWQGQRQGMLLVLASAVSVVWSALLASHAGMGAPRFEVVAVVEVLRDGAWLAFLLSVLGLTAGREGRRAPSSLSFLLGGFLVVFIGALLAPLLMASPVVKDIAASIPPLGFVVTSVLGLALIEQLFRNTRMDQRWAIKFLCFGLGGLFAYDFFLYSTGLLFKQINPEVWAARGFINVVVVPFIAVSARRNPDWSLDIFVSRHIVFHTAALVGAGGYLLLMAAAGYYIKLYGGSWGGVAQAVFLFGALLVLMLVMFSAQLRSKAKVFVSKHFFRNRYDYREEWLRFTHTLSTSATDEQLRENIVRAIAEIVEAPGGVMWSRTDAGHFYPVASYNCALPKEADERDDSSLMRFLLDRGWVVVLNEVDLEPEVYDGLAIPAWVEDMARPWLVIPLVHRDDLLGFVVVLESSTKRALNWEDTDMLKTVGRQAASYLALFRVSEALAESRQFDAFNRLSAFVVHDLKNLVAQLSLVVANAKKHVHNPEFVEDAINTVDNATGRMNKLLAQLRKGRLEDTTSKLVNLKRVLCKVIDLRSADMPSPTLECLEDTVVVSANPDQLAAILEHLVQNAQEATGEHGRVRVRLDRDEQWAVVEIEDDGCGMNTEFISRRLFRPFDTTKGNAGMGIGVYESREFVRSRGGEIQVSSEPGHGTTFRLNFPLEVSEVADDPVLRVEASH